jgi:hypothetical protein
VYWGKFVSFVVFLKGTFASVKQYREKSLKPEAAAPLPLPLPKLIGDLKNYSFSSSPNG